MIKGLGNLANLGSMLQQAKEMGTRMQAIQVELKEKRVTGAAGGGLVEIDANGAGEVLAVRLDADIVAKGDREMLEDLLPMAINDAHAKAQALHAEAMQEAAGGLDLPGVGEALAKFTGDAPAGG